MTDAKTWAERIAAWRASGLSAVKFCEGRDFTAPRLWSWAAKMRSADSRAKQDSDQAKSNRMRFARVVRMPAPADARPVNGSLAVELHGVRVVVSAGFDRATLSRLLDEIETRGRTAMGN